MRLRRLVMSGVVLGVLASALVVLGLVTTAYAATASPAWRIVQATTPTNLKPGSAATGAEAFGATPRWMAFITNIGGATSEPATVTDILPPGVEASSVTPPEIAMSEGGNRTTGTCSVSGQEVTCAVTKALSPGGLIQLAIPLEVETTGEVSNEVAIAGGGAAGISENSTATITSSSPGFGFLSGTGLRASAFSDTGTTALAGAHPYDVEVGAEFPSILRAGSGVTPAEGLRSIGFNLPGGLVVNPSAVPVRCTAQELSISECPVESQVGVVEAEIAGTGRGAYPVYSIVAPAGHAAELAFNYAGDAVIHILGGLGGNFHLTAESRDLLTHFPIVGVDTFLWGIPSDPGHDQFRRGVGCREGCSVNPSPSPFLTMPSSCSEPNTILGSAESWLGTEVVNEPRSLTDAAGQAARVEGCGELAFEPSIEAKPTTSVAESPSGLDFAIHQPQDESLEGRATATLRDVSVTLPEGMTLNPSAANGLSSCTEGEMGYAPEEGKIRFTTTPQTCPDAAKVGTVEAKTPLLEESLPGSIYVAKPFDNPFSSLLAIYLAVEGKRSGIVAKLAGKVEPNPITGQLVATFTENPELPLNDIDLHFFEGSGGVLSTPLTCGTQTIASTLTPWSTPEGADVHPASSFQITTGCSASEATAPKAMSFTAGTSSPLSGAYSPFVLRLARPDGSQHITGIETTLPEGLLGKLAGIAYCPESGIAQAISREVPEKGKEELTSPSCPSSSEVGTVTVTAGSGSSPVPVSGHAYLAGPYKGAALSLVVIVPAVTGPFDLGDVVDRVALQVGEYDARIHAVADPLPTIRDGIPLDVRSIELKLDRQSFTLNPTSCEVKAIEGAASTQAGQSVALQNRFQVGECQRLGFKPKISLSLSGATGRTGHPALKATVTYPKKGEFANIARAQVALPHAEFLHQSAIAESCTKPVLAARACPAKSIYGKVRAWTPLLDKPLEGPVYLVGGYGYKLPALVAELNGQIRVLLVGKIDTGKRGGIRNTFESVPDAPVQKFVLQIRGGKRGLLENSEDICERPRKAGVAFTAQNGRSEKFSVKIGSNCKALAKNAKGKSKH